MKTAGACAPTSWSAASSRAGSSSRSLESDRSSKSARNVSASVAILPAAQPGGCGPAACPVSSQVLSDTQRGAEVAHGLAANTGPLKHTHARI
jgi:hypothetical protein